MKIIFFMVMLFVVGCSTNSSSVCNLNLVNDGWRLVDKNSNNQIKPLNDSGKSKWYKNSDGDYFVCHAVVSNEECGGIYEIFKRQSDGTFINEEIFCME